MNLSNKYISAEDIESVEQLREIFEVARAQGFGGYVEEGCIKNYQDLAYIRFSKPKIHWSTTLYLLPDGYTRIKPADILTDCYIRTSYYDGEWHDWHGGDCPVHLHTFVEVELENGDIESNYAVAWSWGSYRNYGGAIIRFRVLNSTTEEQLMGHPRAPLLREIAEEAKVNPEFWKAFEVRTPGRTGWYRCYGEANLYHHILNPDESEIRRKPRTVSVSGEVSDDAIRAAEKLVEMGAGGLSVTVAQALLDLREVDE